MSDENTGQRETSTYAEMIEEIGVSKFQERFEELKKQRMNLLNRRDIRIMFSAMREF